MSVSGWVYVLLCLVIGLAAVNSNNNVLFLITSLLLSLLFLSGLTALYNISKIQVRARSRNVLTADAPGTVMLGIENRKRFSTLLVEISLGTDSILIPVIPGRKEKNVYLTWVPSHRGKPALPRVELTSSFPFGFVRRGAFIDTSTRMIVAPRPAGNIDNFIFSGNQQPDFAGGTGQDRGDWKGIRRHRPGEGKASVVWRRLDWHKLAMGGDRGQWPAHSFTSETAYSLILDWDDSAYAHLDTEKRLSVLRSLLDKIIRDNQSWELRIPGKTVTGNAGINYERALEALALVEPLPGSGNF